MRGPCPGSEPRIGLSGEGAGSEPRIGLSVEGAGSEHGLGVTRVPVTAGAWENGAGVRSVAPLGVDFAQDSVDPRRQARHLG